MHIADPAQLKGPLDSVAAFRCNPQALAARLRATPVDPYSAPGPARLGAIELSNGSTIGVVIHDHGSFAEVLAQLSTAVEQTLLETFRALDVPVADIQWIREGIDQAAIVSAMHAETAGNAEGATVRVELAAEFEKAAQETLLSSAESQALTLLVLKAMREPYLAPVIGDTGIRRLWIQHTIFPDGNEIAPLEIFYRVADDRSAVTILDVQRRGVSDVYIGDLTFFDAVNRIMKSAENGTDVQPPVPNVLQHRPRTVAATVLDIDSIRQRAS